MCKDGVSVVTGQYEYADENKPRHVEGRSRRPPATVKSDSRLGPSHFLKQKQKLKLKLKLTARL